MLGSLVLNLKGMRVIMFQPYGFYDNPAATFREAEIGLGRKD